MSVSLNRIECALNELIKKNDNLNFLNKKQRKDWARDAKEQLDKYIAEIIEKKDIFWDNEPSCVREQNHGDGADYCCPECDGY